MANRYAHLRDPDGELDFHGLGTLSPGEINRKTITFVKASAKAGHARIRVITGKGNRSAHGPVVRPQVQRTLRSLEKEGLVASFRSENIDKGGDGAFLVTLT